MIFHQFTSLGILAVEASAPSLSGSRSVAVVTTDGTVWVRRHSRVSAPFVRAGSADARALPACPGGINSPCSNHGTCDDGHLGNGTCSCEAGFGGVACELCSHGFYGATCKGEQRRRLQVRLTLDADGDSSSGSQPVTAPNTGHVTADAEVQVCVSAMLAGRENAANATQVSGRR